MPNMFGGDQFHPAYDCRTEIRDDQVMVGNRLYTLSKDGQTARWEDVDGSRGVGAVPQALKDKLSKKA